MNKQSEAFQIIVSSKDHQQLVDQIGILTLQKENLLKVIQEQNKRLQLYAKNSEELAQYPKKIFHLSKTVLSQSKIIIQLQQLSNKLKTQHNDKRLKQEIHKQKLHTLSKEMQDLTAILNSNNIKTTSLISQNYSLKAQLQESQTHIANLQNQITYRELQLQQIKKKVQVSQINDKEKDAKVINEMHLLDQREKKIAERQQLLKNQQKSNEQKFKAKILQLQNQYTKRIQSLKEYIAQYQQIQKLSSSLQKLSILNDNNTKKIKALQKKLTDANSKIDYLKQYYQDEDNIQNLFLDIYIKSLDKYRTRLIEVSQKHIQSKILDKKNQLIKVLQKRIKEQLHLS